jgi:glycosyltransferase involved in cell wall biosynthesis
MKQRLDIGLILSPLALVRGGLETSAAMLTRGFAARGHRITLVAGTLPGARLPDDLAELPAQWLLVPHLSVRSPLWRRLGIPPGAAFRLHSVSFNAACSLHPRVRRLMATASVTMTFLPRETAHFAAWRRSKQLAHVSYFPGGGRRWLARDRSTIRLVNPAVAIRESDALAEFPAHGILNSGVPRHWLDGDYEVRPVIGTLLFAGRLEGNKGVMELLSIYETLARESAGLELRIAGDGPLRGAMDDWVRGHGLADRVSFLGAIPQERIRTEMRRADLLIFPTHHENFPLTLIEASAVGLPFVTSDIMGIRGMVHGRAVLVAPGSEAWVGEIRGLMRDSARRRQTSDCGRHWAADYTWDQVVEKAEQYLLRAIEECRRDTPPAPESLFVA